MYIRLLWRSPVTLTACERPIIRSARHLRNYMRVRLIQLIDYWVGVPLCAVLSVFDFVLRLFLPRIGIHPKKILFLELSEMGSAIIAHSSLERAKRLFPDSELFFLVFKKNAESVQLLDLIPPANIITIDERNFFVFTWEVVRALWTTRRLGIDTTVDLELFSRFTAIFSYLSGARNRIGFHNYTAEGLYRGSILTHRVFYNPHQHMAYNFLALVHALDGGEETDRDSSELPLLKRNVKREILPLPQHRPSRAEQGRLRDIIKEANTRVTEAARLLVVNPDPGDQLPIRGWPLDRFVATTKQLLTFNPDLVAVVIGLGRSKPFADAIRASVPEDRFVDLTGKTKTLRDVVTLFTMSELLITNDSGPAHFASLTAMPSITLFGPETPSLYGPLGPDRSNVFAEYACSPCLSAANHRHTVCTNSRCLQAIDVAQVVALAQTYLTRDLVQTPLQAPLRRVVSG